MSNDIPRRICVDRMTPAIRLAIYEVEDAGCDPLLTDAVILLGQAKDKVSDFVRRLDAEGEINHDAEIRKADGYAEAEGQSAAGPD